MATNRIFQDMLNEYLPNTMLKEEVIRRDYILKTVNKDNNWNGGKLVVPFKSAGASSVKFGGLTDSNDIAQSKYVRGSIDDYREVWGSLIFNQRDIMEHSTGKINEGSFLRLLPDELEDFMDYKKQVVSVQLGSGPHFAVATTDGNATGEINVTKIERFSIDQKVVLDDDDTAAGTYYVLSIDSNNKKLVLSATRGGAVADISAYTTAQNAKFYHDGVFDAGGNHDTFISMRDTFLSLANGGSANVHGKSKLSAPILQAVNIDGSAITATNILESMFDAYTDALERGKGRATEYLMSLKNFGSVMKQLELQKGSYRVVEEPSKSLFGWVEMTISNVVGNVLKIVGIQEMDDDIIPMIDWRGITFRSNGYFKKRKSPDGLEYYEVRNSSGYEYIVDLCLFGEMEYKKPGQCAIIHSINY